MVSSQCEGCEKYVSLVEEQLAAGDYCNKHRMWLDAVQECSNVGAEAHKPRDGTG